jgi:hypothetical protein
MHHGCGKEEGEERRGYDGLDRDLLKMTPNTHKGKEEPKDHSILSSALEKGHPVPFAFFSIMT